MSFFNILPVINRSKQFHLFH